MTKNLKYLMGALALCSVGFVSCSDDDPESTTAVQITLRDCDITYNADMIWDGYDNASSDLILRGFEFTHAVPFPNYVTGFVAASINGADRPAEGSAWYDTPWVYEVMPGGGTFGNGTPYLVAYWDTQEDYVPTDVADRSCALIYSGIGASQIFEPVYVKVTNTAYAYYTMLEGNDFSKKFEKGDWFKLTAHGVHADGTETTTDFYLADMDGKGIVSDWETFDLTSLGKVVCIYFTMSSSDNGQYGINTPTYFALDQFTAQMTNY